MAQIEDLEMDARRAQLTSDVRGLVDRYRAIFAWDVPGLDEPLSVRLIVKATHQALDNLEQEQVPAGPPHRHRSDPSTPSTR